MTASSGGTPKATNRIPSCHCDHEAIMNEEAPPELSCTQAAAMIPERAARLFRTPAARALAPLAVVLLVGAVFHNDGAFYAWDTHRALLRSISVQGILACGMTIVILAGGIDLSVGSVLGLSAVAFALFTMPL